MNIIPFSPKPLAARKATAAAFNSALSQGVGSGGFPFISIKGKAFHIVRNGEKTLVTKPGEDDPASSLEVIIVGANPNLSKVYYAKGFEEGSTEKPTCYSNDGKGPASDAASPQSKSCATCVHNQWGAKVNEKGQKMKACADSRRIAVVPVGQLNDPMLIRVPAASLKTLTEYAKVLDGHGYPFNEVVTKIGFDYAVAHPALTFKAIGLLPAEAIAEVAEVGTSDLVQQITGVMEMPHAEDDNVPAAAAAEPEEPAEEPAAVATPEVEAVVAKAAAKPKKAAVKVEEPVAAVSDEVDSMLNDLNFDD